MLFDLGLKLDFDQEGSSSSSDCEARAQSTRRQVAMPRSNRHKLPRESRNHPTKGDAISYVGIAAAAAICETPVRLLLPQPLAASSFRQVSSQDGGVRHLPPPGGLSHRWLKPQVAYAGTQVA